MAFRVQQKCGDHWRVLEVTFRDLGNGLPTELNPFRLMWTWDGKKRKRKTPRIPVSEWDGMLVGGVTPAEAEFHTGLHAPVCFDKIMDLM